jgi:hypothetical protein
MSEFRTMAVTVQRGEDFHTITLDDTHDVSIVERLENLANSREWEIVSVVIDGWDFTEEMWPHIGHMSNIPLLFQALCDDPYQADVICAFITVNDCADVDTWEDCIYLSGTDHEEVCREWAEAFYKVHEQVATRYYEAVYAPTDPFPSWMELDWRETLDNIASEESSSVVEMFDMVYYFG